MAEQGAAAIAEALAVLTDPAAMHQFLASLRGKYGSLELFAAAIGVTSAPAFLRSALLESA
jgi:hypothetical protein